MHNGGEERRNDGERNQRRKGLEFLAISLLR